MLFEKGLGPADDVVEAIARNQLADVRLGLMEILVGVELHGLDATVFIDPLAGRGVGIEGNQFLDQFVHVVLGQLAAGVDLGAELVFVEFTHDDHPVDLFTLALDGESLAVKGDRCRPQVDRRGQSTVELDLGPAVELAQLEGRKIEKPEVDRFFEFVNEVAGQKDGRNVSLEKPHLLHGMRVEGRLGKCLDKLRVIHRFLLHALGRRANGVTEVRRGQQNLSSQF